MVGMGFYLFKCCVMKIEHQPIEPVKSTLEIDEHLRLHKTGWKLQTIGIYFIYLFVLTAALGLFGDGLLSKTTSQVANVEVEFEKFYRFEAIMELKYKINEVDGGAFISLPASYANSFEIQSVLPEPKRSRFESGNIRYFFEGQDQMDITFYLIPRKMGSIQGMIKVNDSHFEINHFIYP